MSAALRNSRRQMARQFLSRLDFCGSPLWGDFWIFCGAPLWGMARPVSGDPDLGGFFEHVRPRRIPRIDLADFLWYPFSGSHLGLVFSHEWWNLSATKPTSQLDSCYTTCMALRSILQEINFTLFNLHKSHQHR